MALELVSTVAGLVDFFYPHVADLLCKVLPDDNSLSLKVQSFLTSETAKILDRGKGMAGGEYFNARARLQDGLILLNGMVPKEGVTISEMHAMFDKDQRKTEQRRKIIQDHLTSALESANKCFGMGQQIKQSALKPKQTIDALQIRIFCTTLQNLEASAPQINFSVMVDSWITSVKYLYSDPNVRITIDENIKHKKFRDKKKSVALFEQIKGLLLALVAMAEAMQPRGGEKDLDRLKIEVHESQLLQHHYFLSQNILQATMQQVLKTTMMQQDTDDVQKTGEETGQNEKQLQDEGDCKDIPTLSLHDTEIPEGLESISIDLKDNYAESFSTLKPPTIGTLLFDIDDIFVSLEMENQTKRTSETLYYRQSIMNALLSRPIVICKGSPGAGKSTVVQKLCYDYGMNRMPEYDLVLSCKLRDVEAAEKIIDMVLANMTAEGLLTEEQEDEIKVMKKKGRLVPLATRSKQVGKIRTLVILDGLDEVREDICSELSVMLKKFKVPLLHFSLLLTSRPEAVTGDKIRCSPQFVELHGFNEIQREQYIQKHFKGDPKEKERILAIKGQLTENKQLMKLAENPVSLCLICLVQENLGTIKSLPDLYDAVLTYLIERGKEKELDVEQVFGEDWRGADTIKGLARMAFYGLCQGKLSFSAEDLKTYDVDDICTKLGLLFHQEMHDKHNTKMVQRFCFAHMSIQEFHASRLFIVTANKIGNSGANTDQPKLVNEETKKMAESAFESGILVQGLNNTFQFVAQILGQIENSVEIKRLVACICGFLFYLHPHQLYYFETILGEMDCFLSTVVHSITETNADLQANGSVAINNFLTSNLDTSGSTVVKIGDSWLFCNPFTFDRIMALTAANGINYSWTIPSLPITSFNVKSLLISSSGLNRCKNMIELDLSIYDRGGHVFLVLDEPLDRVAMTKVRLTIRTAGIDDLISCIVPVEVDPKPDSSDLLDFEAWVRDSIASFY